MKRIRIAFARLLSIPLVRLAAGLCCALAFVAPAQAASVLPLYLDEVIDTATLAFEGTCIETHSARDAATHLVVTYTTFAVHDVLKGSVGVKHTIKQVGGSLLGENLVYRVPGVPTFAVGQDYVVFLAGVSGSGFSSPIGLEQGRFTVRAEGAKLMVGNGRDFRDLTARMSPSLSSAAKAKIQQAAGPVREMELGQFKQLVRSHLGGLQR